MLRIRASHAVAMYSHSSDLRIYTWEEERVLCGVNGEQNEDKFFYKEKKVKNHPLGPLFRLAKKFSYFLASYEKLVGRYKIPV